MINNPIPLLIALITLSLTLNLGQAASLTYQLTHNWSTNPVTFVGGLYLPAIPRFDPALGTLTNVIHSLAGQRRTEWVAEAPFQSGTYSLGATVQFYLRAPSLSGFPELALSEFTTPNVTTNGFLSQGETAGGILISAGSSNGVVTTTLERFTQTNQFFYLSVYGLDGGSQGNGGGGTFSTLIRYASATVTITYEYTPVTPPTLTIAPAGAGLANVSWTPATGTNWVLQEALNVTGAWTNSSSGWTNPIIVPTTVPTKFYRLFKP
jgi:hypothetical protein